MQTRNYFCSQVQKTCSVHDSSEGWRKWFVYAIFHISPSSSFAAAAKADVLFG